MKKTIFLILSLFILIGINNAKAKTPASFNISFEFFYNSLNSQGLWMEIGTGVYAWKPNRVTYGWKPYSVGRWCWTSYGWYWDSYEPYGWAVYHYGRWFNDNYYGWIWLPDNEWGPSWVEWRYDEEYIGWAPLPPYAAYNSSFGISFSTNWNSPYHHWNFVKFKHFCNNNVNGYYINDSYKMRIHSSSKYRNNYNSESGRIVNNGITRDFVERKIGERLSETRINSTDRLNSVSTDRTRDVVNIYRPNQQEVDNVRVQNIDIKRADRSTSLDLNKVNRMDRTTIENRKTERENTPVRTDDSRNNIIRESNPSRNLNPPQKENIESTSRTNRNDIRKVEPVPVNIPKNRERTTPVERPKTQPTPGYEQRERQNNDSQPKIQRNTEPQPRQRESTPNSPSNNDRTRQR